LSCNLLFTVKTLVRMRRTALLVTRFPHDKEYDGVHVDTLTRKYGAQHTRNRE
jgi:hypothetical protein